MIRLLIFLAIMGINSPAMAAFGFWALSGGPGTPSGCTFTGSIAGSCLPSTDTTDQIVAPAPGFPGFSNAFTFGGSQNLLLGGQSFTCGAAISAGGSPDCGVTTQALVCATPGNISTNTHPWSTEGVVSWVPTGTVSYHPRSAGAWQSGVPAFHPPHTVESTAGSQSVSVPLQLISYMATVCGSNVNTFFVDGLLGNMPNLPTATLNMGSNDTLTVAAPPGGFPFWPAGENFIGAHAGAASPPSNLTVTFDSAAKFGYPTPNDKGFLVVANNGTTITNGTCFWVNPGNNQACIALDAGLDLAVTGFYGDTAGMGMFRGNFRQGTINLTDDIFANMGCMDGGCSYGHNHNIYLGTVPSGGFDKLIATNLSDPDVLENGWNLKLRTPNSDITQSFFGPRVNNGTSSSHGPIDYPCGGVHGMTFSAIGANQYSFNSTISNQSSSFLVSSGEERGTNAVTTTSGDPVNGNNCPTTVFLPSSTAIAATVTGPQTFTTAVNPATFVPLTTFTVPNGALLWDLAVSGMMSNGGGLVTSWTGPSGGLYTVNLGLCFSGEGTIPLTHPGLGIYACFAGTGAITLYATGGVIPVLSNTPSTASVSVPVDPAKFGILVGDSISDPSNTLTLTSITGSGPYTINMSCAHPSFLGGSNCLFLPTISILSDPVSSGTYNGGTGAVSLTLGTDIGLVPGSSVTIGNLFGTGAVSSLNGTFTATAGTGGTTLNYTAATGLTLTIGGSNGGVQFPGAGGVPATLDSMYKNGPIQLVANTTGGACDGANLLCGITYDPRAQIVWHGEQVVGTGVGTACVTAGQIVSLQPLGGSTGAGFSNGQTVTLAGGTFETAAVVTVASNTGGHITSVTVTTPGVYTAFPKTFTQGATSGGGTGAQFQFPQPAPIVTGSGPYTLRLAQASGANCITSAVSGQTYQVQTATVLTYDHDLMGWDGICPNGGPCKVISITNQGAWTTGTISNSILWTDVAKGGPTWGSGTNTLSLGVTDGGGNIQCNNRLDLGTSARCAIPPFTASSFTGNLVSTALTANCTGSCMTISSGTYNNGSGLVTLTVSGSGQIPYGADGGSGQVAFTVSGLTGTGAFASLNGNQIATAATTGTTLTYLALPGLGASTITGGNVNPLSGAAACRPGMYIWDNAGQFTVGVQGHTISGTRIVSGTSPNFVVSIPPGGVVSTDIANTTLSCGWGMPAAAFNGTIDGSGVLTINSDLVGSVHVGDYLADSSGTMPSNIKVTSGSGTTWQTTGANVSAEYMVSVR